MTPAAWEFGGVGGGTMSALAAGVSGLDFFGLLEGATSPHPSISIRCRAFGLMIFFKKDK